MTRHDAIVIGAGLSGLVCARRLAAAGRDVVVLEARDRVGGRLHGGQLAGATVDLGGQWMSVSQPRLLALATELGVRSAPQPRAGRALFADAESSWLARTGTLFAQLLAVWKIQRAIRRLPADVTARAAAAQPTPGAPAQRADAPRLAPGAAAELADADATPLDAWLASQIANPVARARIAMHAELVLAADLASVSLLAYLARLSATGGFSPRGPDLPGGGRDHRFVGGAHQLALRLAADLRVELGQPVLAIDQADGLTVRTPDSTYEARDVVLALPPRLAAAIDSPLPAALRAHAAATQRGAVVKVFAAYARPVWRAAGLSGEAYFPHAPVRAVVDASPPDRDLGILLGFLVGPDAESWHLRPAADRRAAVLAQFATLAGPAPALDYLEADWAVDAHASGCVAVSPPGTLTTAPAWRGSFGRLHLAGTETATRWPGYMEGAIEAGERAAAAIQTSPAV